MDDNDIQDQMQPKISLRKYLNKLTDDLRSAVSSKVWNLDGADKPARKYLIWEECAQYVEMELDQRADSRAPKENLHAWTDVIGGGVQPPPHPSCCRPSHRCSSTVAGRASPRQGTSPSNKE